MPGDTGPKTNPLQLVFDRYETLLLCWQIGNATKDNCQTALASLEKVVSFTSEHHFSPFYCCWKCLILPFFFSNSVNSLFFNMRMQTGYHYPVNKYEIIQHWPFQGLKWSLCLVANSSPLAHFPEIPNYENLQKRNGPSAPVLKDNTEPEPFLLSKWPYNIHANYVNEAAVCVYVCILVT